MARTDQDLLAMALVGYEAEKTRIETAISEIHPNSGIEGQEPLQMAWLQQSEL